MDTSPSRELDNYKVAMAAAGMNLRHIARNLRRDLEALADRQESEVFLFGGARTDWSREEAAVLRTERGNAGAIMSGLAAAIELLIPGLGPTREEHTAACRSFGWIADAIQRVDSLVAAERLVRRLDESRGADHGL